MFIALVDFQVTPEQRAFALATLRGEAGAVGAIPGCLGYRPYTDPASETHVGVIHEWQSEDAFRAYLASDSFAASGRTLRPLMTAAPSSRRYKAELLETVA